MNATRSRVCSVELRFYHERYHNVGYILYCNECWHICTSGLWCSHLIADELSARLVSAIKRDDLDELKMLLELGADPDSRSVEVDEVGYPKVSYWKSTKARCMPAESNPNVRLLSQGNAPALRM